MVKSFYFIISKWKTLNPTEITISTEQLTKPDITKDDYTWASLNADFKIKASALDFTATSYSHLNLQIDPTDEAWVSYKAYKQEDGVKQGTAVEEFYNLFKHQMDIFEKNLSLDPISILVTDDQGTEYVKRVGANQSIIPNDIDKFITSTRAVNLARVALTTEITAKVDAFNVEFNSLQTSYTSIDPLIAKFKSEFATVANSYDVQTYIRGYDVDRLSALFDSIKPVFTDYTKVQLQSILDNVDKYINPQGSFAMYMLSILAPLTLLQIAVYLNGDKDKSTFSVVVRMHLILKGVLDFTAGVSDSMDEANDLILELRGNPDLAPMLSTITQLYKIDKLIKDLHVYTSSKLQTFSTGAFKSIDSFTPNADFYYSHMNSLLAKTLNTEDISNLDTTSILPISELSDDLQFNFAGFTYQITEDFNIIDSLGNLVTVGYERSKTDEYANTLISSRIEKRKVLETELVTYTQSDQFRYNLIKAFYAPQALHGGINPSLQFQTQGRFVTPLSLNFYPNPISHDNIEVGSDTVVRINAFPDSDKALVPVIVKTVKPEDIDKIFPNFVVRAEFMGMLQHALTALESNEDETLLLSDVKVINRYTDINMAGAYLLDTTIDDIKYHVFLIQDLTSPVLSASGGIDRPQLNTPARFPQGIGIAADTVGITLKLQLASDSDHENGVPVLDFNITGYTSKVLLKPKWVDKEALSFYSSNGDRFSSPILFKKNNNREDTPEDYGDMKVFLIPEPSSEMQWSNQQLDQVGGRRENSFNFFAVFRAIPESVTFTQAEFRHKATAFTGSDLSLTGLKEIRRPTSARPRIKTRDFLGLDYSIYSKISKDAPKGIYSSPLDFNSLRTLATDAMSNDVRGKIFAVQQHDAKKGKVNSDEFYYTISTSGININQVDSVGAPVFNLNQWGYLDGVAGTDFNSYSSGFSNTKSTYNVDDKLYAIQQPISQQSLTAPRTLNILQTNSHSEEGYWKNEATVTVTGIDTSNFRKTKTYYLTRNPEGQRIGNRTYKYFGAFMRELDSLLDKGISSSGLKPYSTEYVEYNLGIIKKQNLGTRSMQLDDKHLHISGLEKPNEFSLGYKQFLNNVNTTTGDTEYLLDSGIITATERNVLATDDPNTFVLQDEVLNSPTVISPVVHGNRISLFTDIGIYSIPNIITANTLEFTDSIRTTGEVITYSSMIISPNKDQLRILNYYNEANGYVLTNLNRNYNFTGDITGIANFLNRHSLLCLTIKDDTSNIYIASFSNDRQMKGFSKFTTTLDIKQIQESDGKLIIIHSNGIARLDFDKDYGAGEYKDFENDDYECVIKLPPVLRPDTENFSMDKTITINKITVGMVGNPELTIEIDKESMEYKHTDPLNVTDTPEFKGQLIIERLPINGSHQPQLRLSKKDGNYIEIGSINLEIK